MGFWKLAIGEAIVFMLFNGEWIRPIPSVLAWSGYIGGSIIVGILSFIDLE